MKLEGEASGEAEDGSLSCCWQRQEPDGLRLSEGDGDGWSSGGGEGAEDVDGEDWVVAEAEDEGGEGAALLWSYGGAWSKSKSSRRGPWGAALLVIVEGVGDGGGGGGRWGE